MPPIGGNTIYMFGDTDVSCDGQISRRIIAIPFAAEFQAITDPDKILTVRVHDECNGSDVFGSDICTCRPYLVGAKATAQICTSVK